MDPRKALLQKLAELDAIDPEHLPVVPLEAYFAGNDQEDSIAPNQCGYGRPSLRDLHAHFKRIEARDDVQGVFLGLHQEWSEALGDDELWPAAENIHVLTSAPQEVADTWIQGLESGGISPGWPYGRHAAAPEPIDGFQIYTVYWD